MLTLSDIEKPTFIEKDHDVHLVLRALLMGIGIRGSNHTYYLAKKEDGSYQVVSPLGIDESPDAKIIGFPKFTLSLLIKIAEDMDEVEKHALAAQVSLRKLHHRPPREGGEL